MTSDARAPSSTAVFVERWSKSAAHERANYQLFLTELCDVLGVPRPAPSTPIEAENSYVFEKTVTFKNPDGTTSPGRIDLYRRGHFVCETKQGSQAKLQGGEPLLPTPAPRRGHGVRETKAWDATMVAARGQAEGYVRALPDDNPPFILVVDVGYSVELYSDFSRLGKIYTPFPDARSHRIYLKDLEKADLRDRLRLIWTDPFSLDPSRRSAKATREIADHLARLARSLEAQDHHPEVVAAFLMRCLFTLFAEDVGLIDGEAFTVLLKSMQGKAEQFQYLVPAVWTDMNTGTAFNAVLRKKLMRFNGDMFAQNVALPLSNEQLDLLIEAAGADWKDVEPAIFGTLLERALDSRERHKLGAHYTPRAYVERLVLPTIIEPLREEWDAARAAAITQANAGKRKEAVAEVRTFLQHLCDITVLDPACGTGNFLYVTLEHMKRLEGEVRELLGQFGEGQQDFEHMGLTVDPHQFKGIEINPRAAGIADLVLWIGYLQWHFKTWGNTAPREPVLKAFKNIECRDAVLAFDKKEMVTDDAGKPVTRWDGRTMKKHPVTGEDVPDESARTPMYRYTNPRKAGWPKADFVIGNPPFIGNKYMRVHLGDGYVESLRRAHGWVPESADFVMYWWDAAAHLVRKNELRRFGLITTNSITQAYNRQVISTHMKEDDRFRVLFAIPDHPWVDSGDGAKVRIAMTAGTLEKTGSPAQLVEVVREQKADDDAEIRGIELRTTDVRTIHPDLTAGTKTTDISSLRSNDDICFQGVTPLGEGFRLSRHDLNELGFSADRLPATIRRYAIGRDLAQRAEERYVIDFLGMSLEQATRGYPELLQILLNKVKPERDHQKRDVYRTKWWVFAEPRVLLRPALYGLRRYIATCQTARHRVFMFLPGDVLPDQKVVAIGTDDAFTLGVLSSRIHVVFATRVGSWLGVGNDSCYNPTACFKSFPFPAITTPHNSHICDLGEQLDMHRKKQQGIHRDLTITDMYNVLEKLRNGEPLSAKDKKIHEQGLVSVLKQIHDDLDAAVFEAYRWPKELSDEQILERLVAVNSERAAEEKRGLIRWLRPEFQNRAGAAQVQAEFDLPADSPTTSKARAKVAKQKWPAAMADQAEALRSVLGAQSAPATPAELARFFLRANVDRVEELLETLLTLGQARRTPDGKYTA